MTKDKIILELKTYEKYKNHSNSGLKRQLKSTLESLLSAEKIKKDEPVVEKSKEDSQVSKKDLRDIIGNEFIELGMELFAEELGISKGTVATKFKTLMKNSSGKQLSNYEKLKCMGFDFGMLGI